MVYGAGALRLGQVSAYLCPPGRFGVFAPLDPKEAVIPQTPHVCRAKGGGGLSPMPRLPPLSLGGCVFFTVLAEIPAGSQHLPPGGP